MSRIRKRTCQIGGLFFATQGATLLVLDMYYPWTPPFRWLLGIGAGFSILLGAAFVWRSSRTDVGDVEDYDETRGRRHRQPRRAEDLD